MSIQRQIDYQCGRGSLVQHRPRLPGTPERRSLYVTCDIERMLDGRWIDEDQKRRWATLRADFDRFIEEEFITVPNNPRRARTAYMARLEPASAEVWEIRSRSPQPSLRVFGRFARLDVFVALLWEERKVLGPPTSRQWRDAAVACRTTWTNLFFSYPPLTGSYPNDYISGAVLI